VRLLKEIAGDYDRVARTLVLLGYQVAIPSEIEKLTVRFTLSLPDKDAILGIVKSEVADWQRRNGGVELKGERDVFDLMLRHLAGLPEVDVRRLVRSAFADDGLINGDDLPRLIAQKRDPRARQRALVRDRNGALRRCRGAHGAEGMARPAACAIPRRGFRQGSRRPRGHHAAGRAGMRQDPPPRRSPARGACRCCVSTSALYNKFLGETERNLREALKTADAMAPCVLWIDEMERAWRPTTRPPMAASRGASSARC
jgi:hypothetical protein